MFDIEGPYKTGKFANRDHTSDKRFKVLSAVILTLGAIAVLFVKLH